MAPGAFHVVGPDGHLWSFSSNPSIHDPALVVSILERLYGLNLVDLVSEELLIARVTSLTRDRFAQLDQVLQDAASGSLGVRPPRDLP